MNWDQLEKKNKLWINGDSGEVKSIRKTYKDDILTLVIIETYIHTRKLLIGKYTGPSIYFYRSEKDIDVKTKPSDPIADLGQYYEMDEDIVSEDGSVIVSLSEKNAEEIKKKVEKLLRSRKISSMTEHISILEEEIETRKEKIIGLKKEIEALVGLDN